MSSDKGISIVGSSWTYVGLMSLASSVALLGGFEHQYFDPEFPLSPLQIYANEGAILILPYWFSTWTKGPILHRKSDSSITCYSYGCQRRDVNPFCLKNLLKLTQMKNSEKKVIQNWFKNNKIFKTRMIIWWKLVAKSIWSRKRTKNRP